MQAETAIDFAVAFWCETLTSPKDQAKNARIEGEEGQELNFMELLLRSSRPALNLDAFKASLHVSLTEAFARGETEVLLYVDYHPQGLLADAAAMAKIPPFSFPFKTGIWVSPDHVLDKSHHQIWPK